MSNKIERIDFSPLPYTVFDIAEFQIFRPLHAGKNDVFLKAIDAKGTYNAISLRNIEDKRLFRNDTVVTLLQLTAIEVKEL